jgi:aminoglycoside adenylyltransferase-like protein
MRRAVCDLIGEWWGPMRYDSAPFQRRGYQTYAVLTMCRVLYTLEFGAVVSKPAAARWARKELDDKLPGLIERALAWTKDLQQTADGDVEKSQELIRLTVERCRQWEPPVPAPHR